MENTITKLANQPEKQTPAIRSFIVMLLFFAIGNTGFSQQMTAASNKITEVDTYLSNLKATGTRENYTHVKSLLDDLHTSVYFDLGIKSAYDDNPKTLFTDPESFSELKTTAIDKGTIEMVTIRLSKLSQIRQQLDLSVFSGYKALKYIYIISTVSNTGQNIISSVKNNPGNYSIFYKIDLGS